MRTPDQDLCSQSKSSESYTSFFFFVRISWCNEIDSYKAPSIFLLYFSLIFVDVFHHYNVDFDMKPFLISGCIIKFLKYFIRNQVQMILNLNYLSSNFIGGAVLNGTGAPFTVHFKKCNQIIFIFDSNVLWRFIINIGHFSQRWTIFLNYEEKSQSVKWRCETWCNHHKILLEKLIQTPFKLQNYLVVFPNNFYMLQHFV